MSASPRIKSWQTHDRFYHYYDDRFLKRSLRPDEYKMNGYGQIHIPFDCQRRLENEVASLRFIKSNTNIPVPTVLDAYEHEGAFYVWTELVPGVDMDDLSPSDQATVMMEVEDHVRTLQSLRSKTIGGPTGIVCPPIRVNEPYSRDRVDKNWPAKSSSTDDFVFCHNDLAQQNIIVNPETLKIAGIIDWESAGYYPAFFEYPFFRDPRGSGVQMKNLTDKARLVDFFSQTD